LRVLRQNAEELPARLELDTARRLAGPRVATLRAFLAVAETEAAGSEL